MQSGEAKWGVRGSIAKIDPEQRRVWGWASIISNEDGSELIYDHQETLIPVAELQSGAYDYVQKSRDAGEMHERTGVGSLIDSIVMTPEIRKAMGVGPGPIGWFVGFEVTDPEVWARIKSGELSEFSIGGSAIKEPVT